MIREVAETMAREWIETKREEIKAAFAKALNSKMAVRKIVDAMLDGIAKYNISVKFNWGDD